MALASRHAAGKRGPGAVGLVQRCTHELASSSAAGLAVGRGQLGAGSEDFGACDDLLQAVAGEHLAVRRHQFPGKDRDAVARREAVEELLRRKHRQVAVELAGALEVARRAGEEKTVERRARIASKLLLVLLGVWGTAYLVRNIVLSNLQEDYVMAARARGIPEGRVVWFGVGCAARAMGLEPLAVRQARAAAALEDAAALLVRANAAEGIVVSPSDQVLGRLSMSDIVLAMARPDN